MSAMAIPLDGVKARQQRMWASGDYAAVAARIHPMAERLCESADLVAGARVLDVATGSGNAAIAAARRDCDVVGIDYVASLLARARARAAAEDLPIELLEADAEALPFADASFDAVLSVVGVMFAPNQEQAAAELLRVCRPGGKIALANWTPTGFVGGTFRTVAKHVPPPAGVKPPGLWGTEQRLGELLAGAELSIERRHFVFRFRSAEHFVEFFRAHYGPVGMAFDALDDAGREHLHADLAALVAAHDREPGPTVAIPSEYLEVIARK